MCGSQYRFVRYPIYPSSKLLDRLAIKLGFGGVIFCPICGSIALLVDCREDLRESCHCARCRASNRQRQLAYVICKSVSGVKRRRIRSLRDLISDRQLVIFNTEARGAIHNIVSRMDNYICSEYLGPQYKSGDRINGILHQDLMSLSFEDETFDLVLSSEVLEHVPQPYDAHREIHRVLKPNGRHIFTVPFYQTEFLDETRAVLGNNGKIQFLREPQYHLDPLNENGTLVYTIFSLEMLLKLRVLNFRTNMYHLYLPQHGILGPNAIVFEAIKENEVGE